MERLSDVENTTKEVGKCAAVGSRLITAGVRPPATPNTLARLEDPRPWHARGEVGIQCSRKKRPDELSVPMAPPPPVTGLPLPRKKVVLEEDEYVERLGEIIEGDYFPFNVRMTRALKGEAEQSTPLEGISGTPISSPGGSTLSHGGHKRKPSDRDDAGKKPGSGKGGALTKFVSTHTSEDNESFAELHEKDLAAHRQKYFWAYDSKEGAAKNKLLLMPSGKMMTAERRAIMDATCEARPKIGDDRPNQVVETWKHRTRNQLMFSPNVATSEDICRIEQEKPVPTAVPGMLEETGGDSGRKVREAAGEGKGQRRRSSCGGAAAGQAEETAGALDETDSIDTTDSARVAREPVAEGGELGRHPVTGRDTTAGRGSVTPGGVVQSEGAAASTPVARAQGTNHPRVPPPTNLKVIQAHATRFPMPGPRPLLGVGASPIEEPSSSRESVAELMMGGKGLEGGGREGGGGEFKEVPMTPAPVPGMDGDSPLITWGSIEGTPMILDPRATPLPDGTHSGSMASMLSAGALGPGALSTLPQGPHFELKDLSRRDKLAHKLEASDTRRRRSKGQVSGEGPRGVFTPTPGAGRRTTTPFRQGTPSSTPNSGRRSSRRTGVEAPLPTPLTPAARYLASKLVKKLGGETPFGGGITPGRQKKRTSGGAGMRGERGEVTPRASPMVGGGSRDVASPRGVKRSKVEEKGGSLTDGLLAV
ncbi:unnamed protein product [Discosporangium mesarthrocarpum]